MNTAVAVSSSSETPEVGALIRAHRLRIGMTQRQLADLSTISVRAIRDLEQGRARRPRTDTVRLMAEALRLGPRARAVLEEAGRRSRGTGLGAAPAELPAPPTALHPAVGRDTEVGVLVEELSAPRAERLVNVVGLTGVGKTRLALEVAARLHTAGMPVLWWDGSGAPSEHLATAPEPVRLRLSALTAGLYPDHRDHREGAGGTGAASADGWAPAADLAALVGDGPALLVLDGVPAAPGRLDRLARLLRDCPGLRVLATGEDPWEVPGERVFLLGPLEVPAATEPGDPQQAAVRMFLHQVRRVRPEFTPDRADLARAAAVCRGLDGHPAALAAAASWLVVCDLAALCGTLDADPAALLDHLGGHSSGRIRDALDDRLDRLPAGPRELLDLLCDHPAESFALADLLPLTGRGLPDSGRLLRELLLSGVVRAAHEVDGSRFRVLGIVRAHCRARKAAAAR
ncbi:helix-turn-helix domain-containing protein [Streptomyces sp. NPDC047097]|uniref:helix-turn-helix domain-containing protein n=1 Tax=Streptomyces sp. NPDC047097 TaxID=3155260 RepID=UPI0033D2D447